MPLSLLGEALGQFRHQRLEAERLDLGALLGAQRCARSPGAAIRPGSRSARRRAGRQRAAEDLGEHDVELVEVALVLDQQRARQAIEIVDRLVGEVGVEGPHQVEEFARRHRHARLAQGGEEGEEHAPMLGAAAAARNGGWKSPPQSAMLAADLKGEDPPVPIVLDRTRYALPRAGADDVEIFAVGDIHGRSDLLGALLDEAAREPRRRRAASSSCSATSSIAAPTASARSTWRSTRRERARGDETVALMGNHEAMMRLALDAATPHDDAIDALQTWIVNGGDQTLAEFVRFSATPADLDDLLSDARESLPAHVADWLASLRSHWRSGGLLFVHAGVNPGVDLESFLAEPWNAPLATLGGDRHWAWVRRPFLSAAPGPQGFGGYFVVHGHTPNDLRSDPSPVDQIRRFRLNLDSGSVMTGVATMAIFRGATAEVVAARGPIRLGVGRVSVDPPSAALGAFRRPVLPL